MTDPGSQITALLQRAAPEPPQLPDPELIRSAMASVRTTRSGSCARPEALVRVGALSLAVALAAAVAIGVLVLTRGGAPPARPAMSPRPVTGTSVPFVYPRTPDGQQAATRAVEGALLAQFQVPHGSRRVERAPVRILDGPGQSGGSPDLIDTARIWVVDGSAQDALQYVNDHLPGGLELQDGGRTGVHGVVEEQYVVYGLAESWQRPSVFTAAQVVVTAATIDGRRSGLRIDAQAVWLPVRDPNQTIPAAVTGVDVTVQRGSAAPAVRRSLGSADARALAAAVNRLRAAPDLGPVECGKLPPDFRRHRDVLTFRAGTSRVTATVALANACMSTTVSVAGRQVGPVLDGGVDAALMKVLGLPTSYGS